MKTYKELLVEKNTQLGADPRVRFIGYGLSKGRALGTLVNVKNDQIIEMPVAENLMVGFAIGLSLNGIKPVVFIERMDFIHNALDAIVNHLDKIAKISRGEFAPAAIIRCIVGNRNKPLYTGETHVQDYSEGLRHMVSFPVVCLKDAREIEGAYNDAIENLERGVSTILVEYKDCV